MSATTTTTILRNSSLPAAFKYKVEEKQPTFTHIPSGETIAVTLGLNYDPQSNGCSSVDIFGALMKAIAVATSADVFKENKEKSALVFNKADNGEMIAACITEFDENGDNYNISITFDANDLDGIKNVINYKDFSDKKLGDLDFLKLVNTEYMKSHNIAITDYGVLDVLIITAFESIYQWLDTNAKDGEIVELVIDDFNKNYQIMDLESYKKELTPVATASVEVVKDVKKMAIRFSEELLAIAKGSNDMQ